MTKDGNFKRRVRRGARERGQRYTEALASIQGGAGAADLDARLSEIDRYDWTALVRLRAGVEAAGTQPRDAAHARALVGLYWRLGEHDVIVRILSELLGRTLDADDEMWARYQRVNHRACTLLREPDDARSSEAVAWHGDLVAWGRVALPRERQIELLGNSTMYAPWKATGREHDWLALHAALSAATPRTPANRYERFDANRTAVSVNFGINRLAEAHALIASTQELLGEEPEQDWMPASRVECGTFEMTLHHLRGDIDALRDTGARASAMISGAGTHAELLHQQLGCRFMMAKQYDLAIAEFRIYIDLGHEDDFMYLSLAASIWASSRDREATLDALRNSSRLAPGGDNSHRLEGFAEFADVATNEEFLAAASSAAPRTA